eukprot:148041-Hanusia_phi.AAC.1
MIKSAQAGQSLSTGGTRRPAESAGGSDEPDSPGSASGAAAPGRAATVPAISTPTPPGRAHPIAAGPESDRRMVPGRGARTVPRPSWHVGLTVALSHDPIPGPS